MYCHHCGTRLQGEQRFCVTCGKAVGVAVVPSDDARMASHIRLLAILWLAFSGLRLLGGVGAFVVAKTVLPAVLGGSGVEGFVPSLVMLGGGFLLACAAAGFLTGFGLLQREPWARPLGLVMGFLSLLEPPLGTALGIYTLWVLLPSRAEEAYRRMVRAA